MAAPAPEIEVDGGSPLESPAPPAKPDSPTSSKSSKPESPNSSKSSDPRAHLTGLEPPRLSPRSVSASAAPGMTASSTPLGTLNAARRPAPPPPTFSSSASINASSDIAARLAAFRLGRQGAPPPGVQRQQSGTPLQVPGLPPGSGQAPNGVVGGGFSPATPGSSRVSTPGGSLVGGIPANFKLPQGAGHPPLQSFASAPAVPKVGGLKPSLAQKRGMKLPGGLPGAPPAPTANGPAATGGRKRPAGMSLSQIGGTNGTDATAQPQKPETMMDKYADYIDTKTGSLRFKGKAVINSQGVEFSSGSSFSISLDEVDTLDELGKGNYGTVYKVRHSRPRIRRPGQGLAGNKVTPAMASAMPTSPTRSSADSKDDTSPTSAKGGSGTTGVVMAMKEIRLELDDAKFAAIIMELDILHRCVSPYIIDFYGAFFQEGAVYICMEFMDGGSIDKLYGDGIPENILRKITLATTMGLKSLKEEHNIIHRDVKPTNILMNTRGQVKICDFGVSGNLVASIAKTNIGCQSYMAPERISSGGVAQAGANPGGGTYSVQSDIWSLGLTIIECAMGRYPYPPETYNNIFSQLSAIVDGDPPDLPAEGFSEKARDFVRGCLNKIPKLRPTYAMLLQHPWLSELLKPATISEEDEEAAEAEAAAGTVTDAAAGQNASSAAGPPVADKEVAEWVVEALERRRTGKMGKKEKPALHAAPLDAVVSPSGEGKEQLGGA